MNKFKQIYQQKNAHKVLLSAMFTMATLGIIYIWSVFILPIESEFGWPRTKISLVFTTTMFCLSSGLVFGGFIHKRMSTRKLLLASIVIMSICFAATSLSQELTTMLVFYGIIGSSVMGIVYNFIIYTCNLWFSKDCAGTVSGLLQTCLAVGTVFLSYFAAGLLELFDWRIVFRILGVLLVISLIIDLKYLKQPETAACAENSPEYVETESSTLDGIGWQKMIKTSTFWCFWLIRLSILCGGIGMVGHAIPAALELGASYQSALFAFALLSFCNGISRTVFGIIWDISGLRKTIALNALICIAGFSLLFFSPIHQNQFLTILAFALCGIAYGGANLIGISFTRTVFGLKHFAENYGFAASPMIAASFIGPYIMAESKLVTQSYHDAFMIFTGGGVLALILLVMIRKISYSENN